MLKLVKTLTIFCKKVSLNIHFFARPELKNCRHGANSAWCQNISQEISGTISIFDRNMIKVQLINQINPCR